MRCLIFDDSQSFLVIIVELVLILPMRVSNLSVHFVSEFFGLFYFVLVCFVFFHHMVITR